MPSAYQKDADTIPYGFDGRGIKNLPRRRLPRLSTPDPIKRAGGPSVKS